MATTSIDIHIGNQLRAIRTRRGLTQKNIGAMLGVTSQQVQKYERGSNRIDANNLYCLARELKIPVGFFFDGLENAPDTADDFLSATYSDQEKELLDYLQNIPNRAFRDAVMSLLKAMAHDKVFIE